jgi:hypothetical protein
MAARFRILSLLALAACTAHVHAQAPVQMEAYDPTTSLPLLISAERKAAAVPAAVFTGPRTPELVAEVRKHASGLQELGSQRAFAGDTEGAIAVFDVMFPAPAMSTSDAAARLGALADARAEDAIEAIVAQARTRRVVILNEAHHVPMHRAFAMRLAAALRKIGYTYLACETFSGDDVDVSGPAPGQVNAVTGVFTRESTFANFVNAALADGWKPVAYDVTAPPKPGLDVMERMRAREQTEADNLVARIFAKDKNARVFIYVGYAHGFKSVPGATGDIDWMAERLHRATGLDILSIDQTVFYAHPERAAEHPLYAGLLSRFPASSPFVLRAPDGSYAAPGGLMGRDDLRGRVDMQVIYPRYAVHDGRPDWLRTLAGRNPHPVPAALLPKQGRRLIKAVRVDAVKDAVPADVVLVEAGKPAPVLMLPPGEFRYVYEE